jgi:hypothetical protein
VNLERRCEVNFIRSDRLGAGIVIGIAVAVALNNQPTLAGIGVSVALIFGLSTPGQRVLEQSRISRKR